MTTVRPFSGPGNWYKGNLHLHSTVSDGQLTPDEVVALYQAQSYSFIAFSDHDEFTHHTQYDSEGFLIMPGLEWATAASGARKKYHFLGIQGSDSYRQTATNPLPKHGDKWPQGTYSDMPDEYRATAQSMIDELKAHGNMVVLNHPVWSRLELEDFVTLDGYFAMEIFNTNCNLEGRTGHADLYWDSLLRRGKRVWGVASDDAHFRMRDYCGGWVMVQADELSQNAIADSLLTGRFYSSQGPEIYDFGVVDGEAYVECSAAASIHFVTFEPSGRSVLADEAPLTSARYRLRGAETYIRVECIDAQGKIAWTNPIFL